MTTEPGLVQALLDPAAYDHPVKKVRLRETHISWVFLTGDYAYKLKKPVDFGFLDFSSLDKRRFYCNEELRLNRCFAPELYLAVVPVTRRSGRIRMGGEGPAVEYAVKMRQFDDDALLDHQAERGGLDDALVDAMVVAIADFHARAEPAPAGSAWGEPDDIQHWFQENIDHIRPLLEDADDGDRLDSLEAWGRREAARLRDAMQRRRREGCVRECHGDLHLGNLVRIGDRVLPFDCIEFNPHLRWIDLMSEIAFLYMDLAHRGLDRQARRFLNLYLQRTGDYGGLALLPYYLVYRALVRAKVAILRLAQETDADYRRRARAEYRAYAELAVRFTRPGRPALLITHGLSGSGKSTLAARLVEWLGAVQLRSDVERKRLFGLPAQARSGSGVAAGIYTPDASRRTYQRLAELAEAVVEAGFPAIVDATFLQRTQRAAFRELAARAGVPFLVLDLQAPPAVLRRRVQARRRAGRDPSEAGLAVLEKQLRDAEPLAADEGPRLVIDATREPDRAALLRELDFGVFG